MGMAMKNTYGCGTKRLTRARPNSARNMATMAGEAISSAMRTNRLSCSSITGADSGRNSVTARIVECSEQQ